MKLFAFLVALACLPHWASAGPRNEGERRVEEARTNYGPAVRSAVEQAGLHYPPRELFIRVFKFENVLEIWARDADAPAFKSVLELPLADVRVRGRKKREGDYRTPEGCYRVIDFNAESAGYLSLRLDYPNLADRIYAASKKPGSDIFIHAGGYSTGCVSVSSAGMAQLYLLAIDTKRRPTHVHIFPHRMDRSAEEVASGPIIHADPALPAFWAQLRPIYDAFETTRSIPNVTISKDGKYSLAHDRR